MKNKNVPVERYNEFGVGDVWTFVALDAVMRVCLASGCVNFARSVGYLSNSSRT